MQNLRPLPGFFQQNLHFTKASGNLQAHESLRCIRLKWPHLPTSESAQT